MPRFMILRMADADTEAGVLPDEKLLAAMGAYMDEMHRAGILRAGDGLKPSAQGARVEFSNGKPRVIDGPFTEAKELVAGYAIIEVGSKEEALEWLKRWPPEDARGELTLELREFFEADDFGPAFAPEVRERQERIRAELEEQQR